jgi:hypothetical protein
MNRTIELKEIKTRLTEIVANHERLKNSYFWSPSGTASGRRYAELKNNDEFANDRYKIFAKNDYRESCKNVYYKGVFYIGNEKTTVVKIKNIIEALSYIC